MKKIKLGVSKLEVASIAVGCMRIPDMEQKELITFITTAIENGANFFDHADVYKAGKCEEVFAKAVSAAQIKRESMIIQTKCGIDAGKSFNFSKEHILKSVDGSLKRLNTDYIDVLLLHRPDALVEPEQVAEAFDKLASSGKVRNFGVSNQKPLQIQLLQKYVKQPIVANQLQLSLTNANMISNGLHVNMQDEKSVDRDGSILDFCRLNDITIQPWSPFQYGFFEGVFLGSPKFPKLNAKVDELAKKYSVSNVTIAMAWILRHPAKMQPVTGTTNVTRLKDCIKATEITLTHDEWYELYLSAGNILP